MPVRERLLIDKEVQGALVGRVVIYWLAGISYIALGSIGSNYFASPDWTITQHFSYLLDTYWAWVPSAILILPMVIYDVVQLSNKFAGPIYRLRSHLTQLLKDPASESGVRFRGDDYWRDLAEPINQLQHRVLKLQDEVADLQSQLHEARLVNPSLKNRAAKPTEPQAASTTTKSAAEDESPQISEEQGGAGENSAAPQPEQFSATSSDTSARTQSGTALLDEASV